MKDIYLRCTVCNLHHIAYYNYCLKLETKTRETDAFAYQLEYLWTLVILENGGWFEVII